jgi:serine/threonine protein kinase
VRPAPTRVAGAAAAGLARRGPGIRWRAVPPAPAEPERPPAAPPGDPPGWRVESVLGRGGFGELLAARRTADGRTAALKVARGDRAAAAALLSREAEALRALGPPVSPELLGEGAREDGAPYLALERIDAPSLAERLGEIGGPMAPGELRERALAVADALAALHARGWSHGDLKPGHVLLAPAGVRLID